MNVCGRYLSCGHYESQSPDGRQILPVQVVGPDGGRAGCLGERHHGKCGFSGSSERTTGQGQQRHL